MNLRQVLEKIGEAPTERGRVFHRDILEVLGERSFGSVLLIAGLITLAPLIGDIPGIPSLVGLMVFLVAIQLLLGRNQFWLPGVLLNRSVERDSLNKTLHHLHRFAGWVDRLLRPRLPVLVEGSANRFIAICCLAIAVVMPAMELVPFSANVAGAALTAFGLALIARDGLLSLIAFLFSAAVFAVALYALL